MQLDKFTVKSQEAIQAAQQAAQNKGNQELQPEHLVKAILEQPEGVVVPVLQKMGVNPSQVLAETGQLIEALPRVSGAGAKSRVQWPSIPHSSCSTNPSQESIRSPSRTSKASFAALRGVVSA